jgi:hypothetical protein
MNQIGIFTKQKAVKDKINEPSNKCHNTGLQLTGYY